MILLFKSIHTLNHANFQFQPPFELDVVETVFVPHKLHHQFSSQSDREGMNWSTEKHFLFI